MVIFKSSKFENISFEIFSENLSISSPISFNLDTTNCWKIFNKIEINFLQNLIFEYLKIYLSKFENYLNKK